jgi:hypothetical protein
MPVEYVLSSFQQAGDQYLVMLLRPIAPIILAAFALAAFGQGASAQMPCANEFTPLRAAVEKEGAAVKALADRKAPREQVCTQIQKFAATEAKYVKFLTDNQSWCGIPPDAVKQLSASHSHTLKLRTQICAGGGSLGGAPQGRAGPPPGPGLSEALGTSQVFTPPSSPQAQRGTYDSLTGNPLQR